MFLYYKNFNLKIYIAKLEKIHKSSRGFSYINYSTLLIIGDGFGGIGYGKSSNKNQVTSFNKALKKSKSTFFKLNLYNNTFFHSISGKHCSTKVVLIPGKDGMGISAGGVVRTILKAMGIKNAISKIYGSNNIYNVIRATMNAIYNIKSSFSKLKTKI